MPRKVPLFVATLLGPLIVAAWILTTDRANHMAKPEKYEPLEDSPLEEGASRLDRTICFETGRMVKSAVDSIGGRVKPIDWGCKVKNTSSGEYEVESSLLVSNRRSPVRYTVLITGGILHEEEDLLDGKWDKIRLHGFHRSFVSLSNFGIPKSRFQTLAELPTRAFLGGGAYGPLRALSLGIPIPGSWEVGRCVSCSDMGHSSLVR